MLIQSSTVGMIKTEISELNPLASMKGRLDSEELEEVQSQHKCLLEYSKYCEDYYFFFLIYSI